MTGIIATALLELETSLRSRVVVRTCGLREATWFILRHFHVTGTVGAVIAKRGPARSLLSCRDML